MFAKIGELASMDVVGERPEDSGTIWRDGNNVCLTLAHRSGQPWPALAELEDDLGTLVTEVLRLIDELESTESD